MSLPAVAAAQYGMPWPAPPPPPPLQRAEPWMPAPPGPPPQPWSQHVTKSQRAPALEPIDLPPAIEQGVDMIYIDEELVPRAVQDRAMMHDISFDDWSGAPVDLFMSVNPIYTDLRRGLVKYRQQWSDLPQIPIAAGPTMKAGTTGERVAALRERLGLASGESYDAALAAKVKEFQSVHGLKADGIAGAGTVQGLNRGARYYEQLIIINMERAKRLPSPEEQRKYVLVDSGSARLTMWENGRVVDSMKLIVGKAETATPMMAAYIRHVSVNPYWNVPPELVRGLIGPRVIAQGVSYLTEREYQVLTDFSENAKLVDPTTVDWQAVHAGTARVHVRQLPGGSNFMGKVKFEFPNAQGIYLHDTPDRQLLRLDQRQLSSGCVRLEDAAKMHRWLMGEPLPSRVREAEKVVPLPEMVPIYITYLTAIPESGAIAFRDDPYSRDGVQLAAVDNERARSDRP